MNIPNHEWENHLFHMMHIALEEFRGTELHDSLKHILDQAENSCKSKLSTDDLTHVRTWIEALTELLSVERDFLYERGYKDCVAILKQLEVV